MRFQKRVSERERVLDVVYDARKSNNAILFIGRNNERFKRETREI